MSPLSQRWGGPVEIGPNGLESEIRLGKQIIARLCSVFGGICRMGLFLGRSARPNASAGTGHGQSKCSIYSISKYRNYRLNTFGSFPVSVITIYDPDPLAC